MENLKACGSTLAPVPARMGLSQRESATSRQYIAIMYPPVQFEKTSLLDASLNFSNRFSLLVLVSFSDPQSFVSSVM